MDRPVIGRTSVNGATRHPDESRRRTAVRAVRAGAVAGTRRSTRQGTLSGRCSLPGLVFGIFSAVYGVAWFAGSVLLGVLYDLSIVTVAMWRRERMSVCSGVTSEVSRTA